MRLLLDTHAFLWWLAGESSLGSRAKAAIADEKNEVFVSAASAWEITTKYRIGKLPSAAFIVGDMAACVGGQGFKLLSITFFHGQMAGALPGAHRDPFDRMLIAQAMLESLSLVSNESAFDAYAVTRIW